jgi:uncharacterized membrane protein
MTSRTVPNMANWDRALSLAVGAALMAYAWKRRRMAGSAMTAGLGFVARGLTGSCPGYSAFGLRTRSDEPRDVLSGSGGIRVKESISIRADARDVFRVWDEVENLPIFMEHVERVERLDDRTTRWTVRAPGGLAVTWEAEVINRIEPQLIAWKSLPGADVVSAGSVRFRPTRRGTQVTVHMQYEPPLGKAGAFGAWLAGHDPATSLRADLRRLKRLMETGHAESDLSDAAAGTSSLGQPVSA